MNRTLIQQIILLSLLFMVFVSVRSLRRKFPLGQETTAAGNPLRSEMPRMESSLETTPASRQLPQEKAPTLTRDFFQPPSLLKEAIRRKEMTKKEVREMRPFASEGVPKNSTPSLSPLELQGIIWGEKPQAIINRKILSTGDTIEQAEVISITPEGVTLSFNGQEHQLTLKESGKHSSGKSR
ncbi:MAG: hypothetical protein HY211_05640 [Candidatus Omnitrophica bacterium]|nr:hypothetical protein [Candidatus Omnitrophota bacterium]